MAGVYECGHPELAVGIADPASSANSEIGLPPPVSSHRAPTENPSPRGMMAAELPNKENRE